MTIVIPIRIAAIAGKPVRFFAGPSGKPELPWHAADDLFVACGFNRPMRQHFARMQQQIFSADICTVATATGPVVIAPHAAAQGLLNAGAQVGERLPPNIAEEYTLAAAAAMDRLVDRSDPESWLRFLCEAAKNSGIGGGDA